jgi:2'-5' RNA ligase
VSPTDERARLFVALTLPPEVVSALVEWRARALEGVAGLRLIEPSSLHITLCFLGSLPVSAVGPVGEACARAVRKASGLSLSDIAWLPPRRPRVVAVRVADPSGSLASLQAAVAQALLDGGWYAPEPRPFLAHVTVARVDRGAPVAGAGRGRARGPESVAPSPGRSFAGATVTLFRSHPGSVYEPQSIVPLEVR